MDPSLCLKYYGIQLELSRQFIESVALSSSDWNLELVMDIGCGPGNSSTYWIDQYFPRIEKLIGIDSDFRMIALAHSENKKKDKIEYYYANVMKKYSLREWKGSVSTIFSVFVFHRVRDQRQAFKNVFDLLMPGGFAAISFITMGSFYFAFNELLKLKKWKPILKATKFLLPEAMLKYYNEESYKKMFEDIGFSVLHCITKPIEFTYNDDEECKNLLMSLHSIGDVSDKLKEEYKQALFKQFLKHSTRDSAGRPTHIVIELQTMLHKK